MKQRQISIGRTEESSKAYLILYRNPHALKNLI